MGKDSKSKQIIDEKSQLCASKYLSSAPPPTSLLTNKKKSPDYLRRSFESYAVICESSATLQKVILDGLVHRLELSVSFYNLIKKARERNAMPLKGTWEYDIVEQKRGTTKPSLADLRKEYLELYDLKTMVASRYESVKHPSSLITGPHYEEPMCGLIELDAQLAEEYGLLDILNEMPKTSKHTDALLEALLSKYELLSKQIDSDLAEIEKSFPAGTVENLELPELERIIEKKDEEKDKEKDVMTRLSEIKIE